MKKRIIALLIALVMTAALGSPLATSAALLNAPELEVDWEEYPLFVSETPDPEGMFDCDSIYAKLTKAITEEDYDLYELQFFDDDEAYTKLHNGMKSAKINPDENRNYAFRNLLMKYDEETGDFFSCADSTISIIIPLSDNMYQYDEEEDEDYLDSARLKVVRVDSNGKLSYPSFKLVSVDDILSVQMTVSAGYTYGYILQGVAPASEDDEEDEDPWEDEDEDPWDDENEDPDDPYDPGEDDPAPTKAPKATNTPTPTPKTNPSSKKDYGPKTGDSHNSFASLAVILLAGGLLAVTLKKLKHA